jgi:hypothetical protein
MSSVLRELISPWRLAERSGLPVWSWPILLPLVVLGAVGRVVSLPFAWLKAGLRRVLRPLTRTRLYQKLHPWFTMSLLPDLRKPLDAYEALGRMRSLRRILILLLALEWLCLLSMGLFGALALMGWYETGAVWATLGMAPLLVLGAVAALLSSWCGRTYQRWRELNEALCDGCGYNREHIAPARCPECGTTRPPVPPGQVPRLWARWEGIITGGAAYLPFGFFGTIGPMTGFLSQYVPHSLLGAGLLLLTVSLAAVAGGVLCMAWRAGR